MPPAEIPCNKPSQIPKSDPNDQSSAIPSVAVSVNPIPWPSIAPTTLHSDV